MNERRERPKSIPSGRGTAAALLESGRRLFARNGYQSTSVRAITTHARANLGAVTYHYGGKEGLYHAVLASLCNPLLERINGASASAARPPIDRIEALIRAVFAYQGEHRDLSALMIRELAENRPVPPPLRHLMQQVTRSISGLIRAGQAEGSIVPGEPLFMTVNIMAHPVYVTLLRRRLRDVLALDTEDPEQRERFVTHTIRFIRRSLEPPRRNPR